MREALVVVFSYFIGAVPFGVLVAKYIYKTDIRLYGSGNTGATNVWRVLGPVPGLVTFTLDFFKGFLPVYLAMRLGNTNDDLIPVLVGVASIAGHNWSVFLKGKGGKGVATSTGVFMALLPKHTSLALVAFAIVFGITKRISVGSMTAALALLGSSFLIETSNVMRGVVLLCSLMILIKHIPNMKRLVRGEEPKVNLK